MLGMKCVRGIVIASLLVTLSACGGSPEGTKQAAETKPEPSKVTPTPEPLAFADVAEYVNAHAPAGLAVNLDPADEATSGNEGSLAGVCSEVDGVPPSQATRIVMTKGYGDAATPKQASAIFEALLEGCWSSGHSARPTGPWTFDASGLEYANVLAGLQKAGMGEFIRAMPDPDDYVGGVCNSVDDASPELMKSAREYARATFDGSDFELAFGKQKTNAAVQRTIALCFSTGHSARYVPPPTPAQENAMSKARDYLDYTSFSRTGLIKQLKYDGFNEADATFGVDHIEVDWMEQAVKKAKEYLDYTSFSRSGLIRQLEYDGFTSAQARHGVAATGL